MDAGAGAVAAAAATPAAAAAPTVAVAWGDAHEEVGASMPRLGGSDWGGDAMEAEQEEEGPAAAAATEVPVAAAAAAAAAAAVAETAAFGGVQTAATEDGESSALRLAHSLLLSGREDVRCAAAAALTDVLIAPAASHPAADYARCLQPAACTEDDWPSSGLSASQPAPSSSSSSVSSSASSSSSSSTAPRPAPLGTADMQFSCDLCDISPILGRSLHSSTFRFNVSTFCETGITCRWC